MLSDDIAHGLLNGTLRAEQLELPGAVYLGFFTETFQRDSGSPSGEVDTGSENSPTGYARKEVTFTAAANQMCFNTEEVLFDAVETDWATEEEPLLTQALVTMEEGGGENDKWIFAEEIPARAVLTGATPPRFIIKGIKVRFPFSKCCVASDYIVHKWLNGLLRHEEFQPPGKVYLALLTAMPTPADSELSEVSGEGYERAEVKFAEAEGQSCSNEEEVEFEEHEEDLATEDEPIVAVAIVDSGGSGGSGSGGGSGGGNWLFATEICPPLIITKEDEPVTIKKGAVRVGFDCCG